MAGRNALQVASDLIQLGIYDSKDGRRSPWLDDLYREFGVDRSSNWDALFVCKAFKVASHERLEATNFPRTASAIELRAFFDSRGLLFNDPQRLWQVRGALVFWEDPEHVGMVIDRFSDESGAIVAIGTLEAEVDETGAVGEDGTFAIKHSLSEQPQWRFADVSSIAGGSWWPDPLDAAHDRAIENAVETGTPFGG